ncbi:methyl-accepting chemotaxis protein [Virgibacillus sp. LDC-1]|uniref:methyl-accepting chemotaxis protein n=1 Tax=Virgibacillus sp. LDC-1 TaxID=3039856 RepID=UPI0024DEC3A5|nr:methyl-accepting chemotaxis protein [Virgibacillus sp. LDC-1]
MGKLFRFKSIGTKIFLGFIIVISISATTSTYYYYSMESINEQTKLTMDQEFEVVRLSNDLAYDLADSRSVIRGYFLYGDKELKQVYEATVKNSDELAAQLKELTGDESVAVILDKKKQWEDIVGQAIIDYEKGNVDAALNVLEGAKNISGEIVQEVEKLTASEEEKMKQSSAAIIARGDMSVILSLIGSALILIAGITTALLTSRSIIRPVRTLMDRMNTIADGNLNDEPLQTKGRDEIAQLVNATNTMAANTRGMLEQINSVSQTVTSHSEELTQSASEVKAGTEQVAVTMEELATGAETQANSASNLASIMTAFAEKIAETNENGEQIQLNSDKVLEMTEEGRGLMAASTSQMEKIDQIVQDAVNKMAGLDKQSQEISKLVTVIQDVAEQTNLLALNAAIEAARAGEHGKGFAVVADEVRKLAEQVSHSVNDITGIVSQIQSDSGIVTTSLQNGYKEVEQGTAQINTTRKTFDNIHSFLTEMVTNIQAVGNNLSEITANSQEMNGSVEEIASVSEQAAAGVEETAASAQQASGSMEEIAGSADQLAKTAEELQQLVQRFKL